MPDLADIMDISPDKLRGFPYSALGTTAISEVSRDAALGAKTLLHNHRSARRNVVARERGRASRPR